MGQKTHPIGLRLGLHREWASSWFSSPSESSTSKNKLSPYLVARGGLAQSGVEGFLINIRIRRVTPLALTAKESNAKEARPKTSESPLQTKIQTPHRFFPVNIQIIKGAIGTLFIVFFFVKLHGRDNTQLW